MNLKEPLADVVNRVPGAVGAILVDNDGEAVVLYAASNQVHTNGYTPEERIKLIAAYHTISLRDASQFSKQFGFGQINHLVHRYEAGTVVTKPLDDGYALLLVLESESYVGKGLLYLNQAGAVISEDL
ncbi:MAG TPA: hypothetical protein VEF04_17575 [Blastocatellia bacterium]|nr:hypothetical protein [Blastocatellia bacterium]